MVFIDSSAFISLAFPGDNFRKDALTWWQKNKGTKLYTTNLVIIETLSWVRYKLGKKSAVDLGILLFSGKDITVERITVFDEQKAWKLFQEKDGRGISMVDCTSAVLMKRLKIKEIFTFDRGFKKLGFTIHPG
jgi:predicted nucleic acid-binding protein